MSTFRLYGDEVLFAAEGLCGVQNQLLETENVLRMLKRNFYSYGSEEGLAWNSKLENLAEKLDRTAEKTEKMAGFLKDVVRFAGEANEEAVSRIPEMEEWKETEDDGYLKTKSIVPDVIEGMIHFIGGAVSAGGSSVPWAPGILKVAWKGINEGVFEEGDWESAVEEMKKTGAKEVGKYGVKSWLTETYDIGKGMEGVGKVRAGLKAGAVAGWAVDWAEDCIQNFLDRSQSTGDAVIESLVEGVIGMVPAAAGWSAASIAAAIVAATGAATTGGAVVIAGGAAAAATWGAKWILDQAANHFYQNESGFVENVSDSVIEMGKSAVENTKKAVEKVKEKVGEAAKFLDDKFSAVCQWAVSW